MLLGNLLKSVPRSYRKTSVNGICFNSKNVKKKYIFFALKGSKTSGQKFINEAILKGASVIISNKKIKKNAKAIFIHKKNPRTSLAEASSNFYKKKPKNIIAVTGTNGKTSVAEFIYQILILNKISAATIGTLGIHSKKYNKKLSLTSIDSVSLHKNLEMLAKKNVSHVIMEASSHGLHQKRLDCLNIKTGIFTNLTHDHLDYHKNMKSYLNSKIYLFNTLLSKNSNIVTDEANKEFSIIKNIAKKRKIKIHSIGTKNGNIKILNHIYSQEKQIVKVIINSKIFVLTIPLIGFFQVKNLLLAILTVLKLGLSQKNVISQIKKIKPISGRLECVAKLKNNSRIIVDFAHTPDALEKSLIALKKQFKKEIVVVFGCGGERDKKKRILMGKIASKYCNKIFITDDNPRNENPKKIRKEIIKGCSKKVFEIGNRKKAIKNAITSLESNQILLVAGKGHETTQDYGHKILNFSDKRIIKKIINKRIFSHKKNFYQKIILNKVFDNKINNIGYNGVSINTKTIKKNDLFFSIKGKKTDGHKFATQALKKGAIRIVASKKIQEISEDKIFKVKNTFSSLNDLAKTTRYHSIAKIIGITGSVGKTTLKNLVSFALEHYGKVYKSPHSYNNKFGVPLSLSNLKQDTEYGVFEIGMDKKGEIDRLSKIVKPEIGVITNISGAHFKNFKTLKDIAKAKSEIISNISREGRIILNRDDKFFSFFYDISKKNNLKITSFSLKKKSDISLLKIIKIKNCFKLKVAIKNQNFYFYVAHSTNNFISNILACIAVLNELNLDLKKIEKKLLSFSIPSGRGDVKIVKKFKKRFRFIDESYNANPLSMLSAIRNMNYYKKKKNSRKIVFLGDMLELGEKSKKFHMELAPIINKSDIDEVFVYGKYIRETFKFLLKSKKGKIFNNFKEANNHFSKIINNNDLLMIKGSNATGLNRFSKNIKKEIVSAL